MGSITGSVVVALLRSEQNAMIKSTGRIEASSLKAESRLNEGGIVGAEATIIYGGFSLLLSVDVDVLVAYANAKSIAGVDVNNMTVTGAVNIPVTASGGAGTMEHFYDALTEGGAAAALAASLFHFRELEIMDLKRYLAYRGVPVKMP